METTAAKTTFQKYPAYKDSGVEWLGQVPSNWDVLPLFALTKLKSISNCPDLELLSVYLDLGVIRFSDIDAKRTNATSLDLSKYQKVEPSDFVLNNQQAWRGSVGVSNYEGIVSPAYIILALSEKLNPSFANYYFRNGAMVSQYLISSKGVGTIQRNLYWPQLRRTYVGIPPLPEQTAIANFLDEKTTKIDQAIAQKELLIELLKERKQIIIQNAVTKGLDPNVKLKDSGVEWIGEIPEHWEVKRFKHFTKILSGYSPEQVTFSNNSKLNYYKVDNLNDVDENFLLSNSSWTIEQKWNIKVAPKGTLLIPKRGGAIGTNKIAISTTDCAFDTNVMGLLFDSKKALTELISIWIKLRNLITIADTTTIPQINNKHINPLEIALPNVKEQEAVLEYIKDKSSQIENSINLQQTQIDKLKEYKATLIDSAVTGKIKVC